jgi:hypothetical protein
MKTALTCYSSTFSGIKRKLDADLMSASIPVSPVVTSFSGREASTIDVNFLVVPVFTLGVRLRLNVNIHFIFLHSHQGM